MAIRDIADFENKMAVDDRVQESKFPRRRTEGKSGLCLKSTCIVIPPSVDTPTEPLDGKKQHRKGQPELDRDVEESEDRPKSKKQRVVDHEAVSSRRKGYSKICFSSAKDLHKTETYLPHDFETDDNTPKGHKGQVTSHTRRAADPEHDTGFNTDVDESDANQHHAAKPLHQTGYSIVLFISKRLTRKTETYLPSDLSEIYDDTPKRKPKRRIIQESSEEDEDSQIDYETPKALRRKVPVSLSRDGSDYAETKVDDSNNESDCDFASGDRMREDREHKTKANKTKKGEMIDLRKVQKRATASKDKRTFRKEVEERREVVAKDKKVRWLFPLSPLIGH